MILWVRYDGIVHWASAEFMKMQWHIRLQFCYFQTDVILVLHALFSILNSIYV